MAIEIIQSIPEEGVDVDAFNIRLEIDEDDEDVSVLTVVIEDKYPETAPKTMVIDANSSATFELRSGTLVIEEGEMTIKGDLQLTSFKTNVTTPQVGATTGDEIPEFIFRQFYYRLISDHIKLVPNTANGLKFDDPDALTNNQKTVDLPDNYRVRIVNENGAYHLIYRFDVRLDDNPFFPDNTLLELLIRDENNTEVLLYSTEIKSDVTTTTEVITRPPVVVEQPPVLEGGPKTIPKSKGNEVPETKGSDTSNPNAGKK